MPKYFLSLKRHRPGYIALTSVLLVSVIVISIAITVSQLSIGEGRSALAHTKGENTLNFVEGCAEDGLMSVNKRSGYTGTKTITRPEGTCSVVIVANGINYDLTATNTTNTSYVRRIHVTFTRSSTNLTITKWEET